MVNHSNFDQDSGEFSDYQLPSTTNNPKTFLLTFLGLPADALSFVSGFLFVIISATLLSQMDLRQMFELPFPLLFLTIGSAGLFILGLVFGFHFKNRPGSNLARIWLIFLIIFSLLLSLAYCIHYFQIDSITGSFENILNKINSNRPFLDAFLLSAIIAYIPLTIRFIPARPSSRLVFWISPITFITALTVGTLGSQNLAAISREKIAVDVNDLQAELNQLSDILEVESLVIDYGNESWPRLKGQRENHLIVPSRSQIEGTKAWQDSIILGSNQALKDSANRLLRVTENTQVRIINNKTHKLNQTLNFDWSRFHLDNEEAKQRLEQMKSLSALNLPGDSKIWGDLKQSESLNTAVNQYQERLYRALLPSEVPRLSGLYQGPVHYDTNRYQWVANQQFEPLSETVAHYFMVVGGLWQQLDSIDSGENSPKTWQSIINQQRKLNQQLSSAMEALADNMVDSWSLDNLPENNPLGIKAKTTFQLLRIQQSSGLTPANFWQTLELSFADAQRMGIPGSNNACYSKDYFERGSHYFRLDCFAYIKDPDKPAAKQALEYRLVYSSGNQKELRSNAKPVEIYVMSPVAAISNNKDDFIQGLFEAVRESSTGSIRFNSRSGSPADKGFSLRNNNQRIALYPVQIRDFLPGQDIFEARAEKI